MTPEALDTALATVIVLATTLGATTLGFAVAWLRARDRAARAEQRADHAGAPGPGHRASLDTLQQSVDAIALEVERIGEAERFVTRLLAEGAAPDGAVQSAGAPARLPTAR